jgi:hypothetical protein
MTKRLTAGVLLATCAVVFTAVCAFAEHPPTREFRGGIDPYSTLPLFFRSSTGTTWIQVGQNCDAADTSSGQTTSQVWCFEGGGGNGGWPSVPPGQDTGSRHERWDHWSKFNPPNPPGSKWWVTRYRPGVGGGTYNAWCGCDSLGGNPACTDIAFWTFQTGYGNDWNYALTLNMASEDASVGGTIKFDIRYDSECNYDYTYLEYFRNSDNTWQTVADGTSRPAIFNAVSGNPCTGHSGTGRCCGDDYFFASDQHLIGGTNVPYHGNSAWVTNVTFPLPSQTGGMRLRWRCTSDGALSDEDGRGDTDGIGAIDNVQVTFTNPNPDVVVTDNFETGDFNHPLRNGGPSGNVTWTPGTLQGDTYDGWHLEFDPKYKNKGNTCTFSNDWMWSSKPAATGIPEAGWDYFLASPVIDCNGWTGGVLEYAGYLCAPSDRSDYTNTLLRIYNSAQGWSLWNDYDGFIIFQGCDFWNVNDTENMTPFLGAEVDSLQMGWEQLDISHPGDFDWGFHAAVIFLVDNVSVGSFDGSATVFTTSGIRIFSDTFSRSDPAHTAQLKNPEEGNWVGNGGTRRFAYVDSLDVTVTDVDGLTNGNVRLFWRVGTGTPPVFGSWSAGKNMVFSQPDPTSTTDEGSYRSTIGNTSTEDADPAHEAGSLGNPAIDPIWAAGQTVEYYIRCQDNLGNLAYFMGAGAITDPNPQFFRFEILPQGRTVGSGVNTRKVLLVDDYARVELDFEHSTGFNPTGGAGFGDFTDPTNDQPRYMTERALALMYGGSQSYNQGVYGAPKWDLYRVAGAGSSQQREPRIISNSGNGVGGIASDLGVPNYDAVVWLQGSFDAYSYADTTRINLKTFLDTGGHLFNTGDVVSSFLGAAGMNADSTVNFLGPYFGTAFTNAADISTDMKRLNVKGVAGTSMAGVTLGLYGECPGLRHSFNRVVQATGTPGINQTSTLMNYQAGSASDNGRAAMIKNVRVVNNGVAVNAAFDIGCLLNDASRACVLNRTFTTDFGLPATSFTGCVSNGVDAPVIANSRFGFDLAQARPNPFSDATTIAFSIPSRSHVQIEVYNILGQKVRTLVNETMEANSYVRTWDGRSDSGTKASSGIYFYKMVAGDYSATRKAVLLK